MIETINDDEKIIYQNFLLILDVFEIYINYDINLSKDVNSNLLRILFILSNALSIL